MSAPSPPTSTSRDEALARALEEATGEAVVLVDDADRITRWSSAAERLFGISKHDALGRRVGALLAIPSRSSERAATETLRRGERWAATSDLGKSGERIVWSATPFRDAGGASGAMYRARRTADVEPPPPASLVDRAVFAAFEAMQENATILDRRYRVIAMNARARADAEKAIGRALRVGDDVRSASPPGLEASFERRVEAALRGEGSAFSLQLRYPNGESFLFAFELAPLPIDGEIAAVLFSAYPIGAQARLADRLGLIERGLAGARVALLAADARLPDMPLVFASEATERLTGYAVADVLGKNARMFASTVDDRGARDVVRRALAEGTSCDVVLPNRRKDGTDYWARVTITPVRDELGAVSHFVGIQEDVTQAMQAEERLRAAMAHERRGEMLAGIVHDLRNTLMVISGQLSFLAAQIDDIENAETIALTRVALAQAAGLTNLLGNPRRSSAVADASVSIAALGRRIQALVRFLLPGDVRFRLGPLPDTHVRGASSRLEEVFINLVLNARDALPHGGTIRLEAERGAPTEARVAAGAGEPWTLRLHDDGIGMSEGTLRRAFEPNFTTKPAGRGSGLGLPMCLEIVRDLGGDVVLASTQGVGTVVSVVLPGAEGDERPLAERAVDARVLVGLDVLLLVPDESVRSVIGTMLHQRGAIIHDAGDVVVARAGRSARRRRGAAGGRLALRAGRGRLPRPVARAVDAATRGRNRGRRARRPARSGDPTAAPVRVRRPRTRARGPDAAPGRLTLAPREPPCAGPRGPARIRRWRKTARSAWRSSAAGSARCRPRSTSRRRPRPARATTSPSTSRGGASAARGRAAATSTPRSASASRSTGSTRSSGSTTTPSRPCARPTASGRNPPRTRSRPGRTRSSRSGRSRSPRRPRPAGRCGT
jgi:PAS domain S-box-containing protein